MTQALEHDLALLLAKHDCSGAAFVEACLVVAAGFYDADELPPLVNADEFAAALRQAFAEGAHDGR